MPAAPGLAPEPLIEERAVVGDPTLSSRLLPTQYASTTLVSSGSATPFAAAISCRYGQAPANWRQPGEVGAGPGALAARHNRARPHCPLARKAPLVRGKGIPREEQRPAIIDATVGPAFSPRGEPGRAPRPPRPAPGQATAVPGPYCRTAAPP